MSIPENDSNCDGSDVLSIAQMLKGLGNIDERIDGKLEEVSCSMTRLLFGVGSLLESLTKTETSGDD